MPSGTSEVDKEQKAILAPPLNTFDLGGKKLALKLYDTSRIPNFVWTHFSEPSDVLEKADNQRKLLRASISRMTLVWNLPSLCIETEVGECSH